MFDNLSQQFGSRFASVSEVTDSLGESPRIDWAKTAELIGNQQFHLIKEIDPKTREIRYNLKTPDWTENYVSDTRKINACIPVVLVNPADGKDSENEPNATYLGAMDLKTCSVRLIAKSVSGGRGKQTCFVKPSESEIYANELQAITDAYCEQFGDCPFTTGELIQRIKSPFERKGGSTGDYRWGKAFVDLYRATRNQ